MIKLLVCDIDGTLTDSTCEYGVNGELSKRFSHRDGRGFHVLRENTDIKTMWCTSEKGGINKARANKLIGLGTLDYFADNSWNGGKIEKVLKVCKELNITLDEVAFIGDDTNDSELLLKAKISGCPADAHEEVKDLSDVLIMSNNGGHGAVREFIDYLMQGELCELK